MKQEIVFATNNAHKLSEVSVLIPEKYPLLSLSDIGCTTDIPETAETLEGNALLKATFVSEQYGLACFSDDTGLEVEALDNAPGIYSARYAGDDKNAEANMQKLLKELNGKRNRKARFRTVIALIMNGETHFFEGAVYGIICEQKRGKEGFGYDPIFMPDGYTQTFAELPLSEKNKISHRAKAIAQLVSFLEKNS